MKLRSLAGAALSFALLVPVAGATEKRPLPEYDGRPAEKPSALLWIPRIALFPLHVVVEYGLRRPLHAIVLPFDRNAAESERTTDRFDVRPVIVLDHGFVPRFGAHVSGRREENSFRLLADTFGAPTYSIGAAANRALYRGNASVEAYAELTRRPDTIFHGFGPSSAPHARIRVALERGEAGTRLFAQPSSVVQVDAGIGVRGVTFRTPIDRDYVAFVERLGLAIDLRPLRRVGIPLEQPLTRGDGVRLEVDGELAGSPLPMRTWIGWGGTLSADIDVTGRERVLSFSATARFLDPLMGGAPSYLEHVTLGGDRYLRGHLAGRLVGRSAFVTGLEWRWPVWSFLDGVARFEVGNVFGEHLRDLSPRLFRLSGTFAMRNVGTAGYRFELLGGVGTEPIADGARVSSVRLLLSASRPL